MTPVSRDETGIVFAEVRSSGTQRVGCFVELPRILRELGLEPGPVLAGAGVRPEAIADLEAQLPLAQMTSLLLTGAAQSGRADFPLILGSAAQLSHLGAVGDLLRASSTLRSALSDFVGNHPRYVRGAASYLIDWPDQALLLGYRVHQPGLQGASLLSRGAIAFGYRMFRELCGALPTTILMATPRPAKSEPYTHVFGRCAVEFGAEHYGLVYSRAALMTPVPTVSPAMHDQLSQILAKHWLRETPDIRDQVLRVLVPSVLSGSHSLTSTARKIGMHPRSLNRALKARGTTFRTILKAARFEMASQLLVDTRMPIRDLALMLGYSEVSAFARFFNSVAGEPPAKWREAAHHTSTVDLTVATPEPAI